MRNLIRIASFMLLSALGLRADQVTLKNGDRITGAVVKKDADKLTVGGELNKLAANVAIGRNFGGVHYRSDYAASVKLGEAITISVLQDQRLIYGEDFSGYTFTRLDGTKIRV